MNGTLFLYSLYRNNKFKSSKSNSFDNCMNLLDKQKEIIQSILDKGISFDNEKELDEYLMKNNPEYFKYSSEIVKLEKEIRNKLCLMVQEILNQ